MDKGRKISLNLMTIMFVGVGILIFMQYRKKQQNKETIAKS